MVPSQEPNPTIVSYNASAVKFYIATSSLVRFETKIYSFTMNKRSSQLQRGRGSCKFRSCRIESRAQFSTSSILTLTLSLSLSLPPSLPLFTSTLFLNNSESRRLVACTLNLSSPYISTWRLAAGRLVYIKSIFGVNVMNTIFGEFRNFLL
jgi:hypothetical protein